VKDTAGVGTASTPTGTIGISVGVATDSVSGTCTLTQSVLGTATCVVTVTPTTVLGTHTVTATFAATNVHSTSNDSQTLTISGVTVTPHSQQYSDQVTFVATLSPATVPATGVTFYVGTQNMGTVSLVAGGGGLTGTLTVALLETVASQMAPGDHTVKAV